MEINLNSVDRKSGANWKRSAGFLVVFLVVVGGDPKFERNYYSHGYPKEKKPNRADAKRKELTVDNKSAFL